MPYANAYKGDKAACAYHAPNLFRYEVAKSRIFVIIICRFAVTDQSDFHFFGHFDVFNGFFQMMKVHSISSSR